MFGYYNVSDLYVGIIGVSSVVRNYKPGYDNWIVDRKPDKPYVIFKRKEEHFTLDSINYGIDLLTNKKYFLFCDNSIYYREQNLNKFVIGKIIPIEQFIQENKKKISKREIIELYQKLNKIEDENKKNEEEVKDESKETEEVKDNILNLILKTNDKVKLMDIGEDSKKRIVDKLSELGEYYVRRMLEVNNSSGLTLNNSEYDIQLECIKRLVEIENQIEDENLEIKSNLTKQLTAFKKNLSQG